jgi:hypothetical protein
MLCWLLRSVDLLLDTVRARIGRVECVHTLTEDTPRLQRENEPHQPTQPRDPNQALHRDLPVARPFSWHGWQQAAGRAHSLADSPEKLGQYNANH